MRARPDPRLAVSDELRFGPNGELRESFAKSGRVHVDRWLPFLILHRSASPAGSIGRRVAVNSPAYLIWSPDDDNEARAALEAVLPPLRRRLGRILLIELLDAPFEPRPHDAPEPAFRIEAATSGSSAARVAMKAFREAAGRVAIDLRKGRVAETAPLEPLLDVAEGHDRLSLTLPQVHRTPEGGIYPQLAHDLTAGLIDSLLCACAAFAGAVSGKAPPYHRALGRSAVVAAALKADKKLDIIARSFDFLLSVSPINTAQAKARFIEGGEQEEPSFRYRPLAIDPDEVKRELYAIDLTRVEDLLLERLLGEKRREIDMQLTMLATRNTRGFRPASMLLYGVVGTPLLTDALRILETVRAKPEPGDPITASDVESAALELVEHYRSVDKRFAPVVEVRDDVSGLLVSGGKFMIASDTVIAASRLDPLLAHEVSVHLLTYFNGATQGLRIFRTGLARYEGIQEGLGVFAEWAVGGLTPARLRLLAGRVVAVDAMIGGASFIEVYRRLRDDFGFGRGSAFDITARVFRSGGLAKDAIYLEGFLGVGQRLATGASLDSFWLGKIASEHTNAIEELLSRGLLHAPVFLPEFLARADARERIDKLPSGDLLDRLLALE